MRAVAAIILLAVLGGIGVRLEAQPVEDRASFEGVVTLANPKQGLLVLQEQGEVKAFKFEEIPPAARLGERLEVRGKFGSYHPALPGYPESPSGSGTLADFEAPADLGDHFLARFRAVLRVPQDGRYIFWLTADDEAELRLGAEPSLASARKIAVVSNATRPGEWDRDPEQKSAAMNLKAGVDYYVEALQREWRGHDHLAVAWEGPGFSRQIIKGEFLSPWPSAARAGGGVLREYWTNSFLTRLAMLASEKSSAGILKVTEPVVATKGASALPAPKRTRLDRLAEIKNYSWVEVEGGVSFIGGGSNATSFELMEPADRNVSKNPRVMVKLATGEASGAKLLNRIVRVRGVCEQSVNLEGKGTMPIIWVQDFQQVTVQDFAESDWRDLTVSPMSELTPGNLELAEGRKVLVCGTVLDYDAKSGAATLRGDDSFCAFSSVDGVNWSQIGQAVPVTMKDSVFAGLAVSSMTNSLETVATFGYMNLDLIKESAVPLGNPPIKGSVNWSNDSVLLRPGGGNDWDATDEGIFLGQTMAGEGEVIARLESFKITRPSDKAGLMMRESLNADAPYVALVMKNGTRLDFQYRASRRAIAKAVNHVSATAPQWLKLTRRQNSLPVRLAEGEKLRARQPVELVGMVRWTNDTLVLMEAYVRTGARSARVQPTPPAIAETRESKIADLPDDVSESEQYLGENYLIRGVVTFMDRAFNRNLLFVQDDSGAALIRILPAFFKAQRIEPGQLLEAKGEVRFASGAPPFGLSSGTILGWIGLPEPLPYPQRSEAKATDSHWVEAQGIVRGVTNNLLLLMERDGPVPVWVGGGASSNDLAQYIDCLVVARGVFSLQVAEEPSLLVPSQQFLQVKEPAPASPFEIPSFAINRLGVQEPTSQLLHRVKVAGIVTYVDESTLIIQDVTAGARVFGVNQASVRVGDHVEVVGFPELAGEVVTLRESLLRKVGEGSSLEPTAMLLQGILDGRLNCWLVQLEGVVLDQKIRDGRQLVELQNGQRVFQAVMPLRSGTLETLAVGSRVRVTGVDQLQFVGHAAADLKGHESPVVATMEVWMRSSEDLLLLERPPWWTWKHTAALLVVLASVILGAFSWITALRRRVDLRTRELRETMGRLQQETEVSATLAERDRLAAEIHDTLEQGLNGIMMQLDAVDSRMDSDQLGARQNLDMARRMVGFSRAEVRHSLWNIESQLLKDRNLGAALAEIARQMSAGNSIPVTMEMTGEPRPLPASVEHHLVRCSQEALNNALKHSRATKIRLGLEYGPESVVLSIVDDGCGFEPAGVLTSAGNHLGLRNLRSRARKVRGKLEILSQPGKGTAIKVTVPLNPRPDKRISDNRAKTEKETTS